MERKATDFVAFQLSFFSLLHSSNLASLENEPTVENGL